MPKVFLPSIKNKNNNFSGQSSEDVDILFLLLKESGFQQRENFIRNSLLDRAAQIRADDMAEKNYFSHTSPDGVTPNQVVRSVGFPLPSHYPIKGNNIESINIGGGVPVKTMDSWFGSPKHRAHVFGEDSFYREQECIGLATAINKVDGRTVSVFISCPCM